MPRRAQTKPLLVLIGVRQARRQLVLVAGAEVWLAGVEYEALCQLVSASAQGSGLARLRRLTASRLRTALRQVSLRRRETAGASG
jgi:hypothetical protein